MQTQWVCPRAEKSAVLMRSTTINLLAPVKDSAVCCAYWHTNRYCRCDLAPVKYFVARTDIPLGMAGKWILPDPSLSTEQKVTALGVLNLPQQLPYNKRIFMHKVLNNNSPNYPAQLFISHQSHYTNSRNNLYVPMPRLDLFKIAYPSLECPSGTPYKTMYFLVSNVICTNICLRINFRQIWTDLFESHVCLNIWVLYTCMPMKEINSDVSAHL